MNLENARLLRPISSKVRQNVGGGVRIKMVNENPLGHGNRIQIYRNKVTGDIVLVPSERQGKVPLEEDLVIVPGGLRIINVDRYVICPVSAGLVPGDRVFQYYTKDGLVYLIRDVSPRGAR